jgi:formylglycine-generating enzyme required for sulfatase activity
LHLLKDRISGNAEAAEPIPGFVKVAYDSAFKLSDAKGQSTIDPAPFYIARTLTTVDQYAAFIADGGYHDDQAKLWGGQGNAWRTGDWDATDGIDKQLQERLARRPKAERLQPARWAEQQAHASRAVYGVNWFEARAYARWLDGKLLQQLGEKLPVPPSGQALRYAVLLPTEAQWERAARAASAAQGHPKADKPGQPGYWPWVQDAATAKLPAPLPAWWDCLRPIPWGLATWLATCGNGKTTYTQTWVGVRHGSGLVTKMTRLKERQQTETQVIGCTPRVTG